MRTGKINGVSAKAGREIFYIYYHQLSRADASVSRDRRTNSFTAKALHPRRDTTFLLVFASEVQVIHLFYKV